MSFYQTDWADEQEVIKIRIREGRCPFCGSFTGSDHRCPPPSLIPRVSLKG